MYMLRCYFNFDSWQSGCGNVRRSFMWEEGWFCGSAPTTPAPDGHPPWQVCDVEKFHRSCNVGVGLRDFDDSCNDQLRDVKRRCFFVHGRRRWQTLNIMLHCKNIPCSNACDGSQAQAVNRSWNTFSPDVCYLCSWQCHVMVFKLLASWRCLMLCLPYNT